MARICGPRHLSLQIAFTPRGFEPGARACEVCFPAKGSSMAHSRSPRCPTIRHDSCLRLVCVRWTMCLAIAGLGFGCSKPIIVNPNGNTDTAGPGRADASVDAAVDVVVDAAVPMVLLPDARSGDAAPAQADSPCRRSVNLRGVTITRPVPFDVVIVADNSDSLSWSRDSLSAGLKNLLARVHGHQARFFVLTTTQYGASSQAAVSPITGKELVSWRDVISGTPYLNAVTTYSQSCLDGSGKPTTCPKLPLTVTDTWTVKGTWQFQMPAPVAEITAAMDDAELGVQQKRIADAVLALGGGGSPQEQPICTLLRYIGQSPTALPKHAVFVVLSDEDDTSSPDLCLAGYDANQTVVTYPSTTVECSSNCPEYDYYSYRPNQEEHLDFSCVPVDDKGTAHPESASKKTLVLQDFISCTGEAARACTDAEQTKAGVSCGAGTLVQSCMHTCVAGVGSLSCSLSRPDNKTDICTQPFDQNGVHYANLADYCSRSNGPGWGTCAVQGLMPGKEGITSTGYAERTTPLVDAQSTTEMIQSFKTSADGLIGKSNYSIESIVLDPAFSCQVKPGQSYAPNLRSLASSASDVFPLCQDYAPALERIAAFADYLIQTTFPLDLDAYEAIDSVVVTNKLGVQRTVAAGSYSYDRAAKLLSFSAGVLTAQDDSLAVNVARYCEMIAENLRQQPGSGFCVPRDYTDRWLHTAGRRGSCTPGWSSNRCSSRTA